MHDAAVQIVYVTAANRDEALAIAKAVVGEHLAACANIVERVTSVYWWQGAVQEDSECVLILKTRRALVDDLSVRVKALHSYECPCVVALSIDGGSQEYLNWIVNETSQTT
ncbi:divalent-cation tolerance protein CutA [Magnetovibrio sp.]|uniref:divalent-cation tolerance protein CutA n=1 Tax=Magnetovibrio sp. TaxID=2024836 RepID=UPI002F92276A